jgi:hypothetical protein
MQLSLDFDAVQNSTAINATAKTWARDHWDYLTKTDTPLINVNSSTKIEKGEKLDVFTGILYLKPADQVTTKTICAAADLMGCKKGCLISSGQLGKKAGSNAATKRTIMYALQPELFLKHLKVEIMRHQLNHGDKLAIRLNGTSDIDFSDLIASMPDQQFYDYTKVYARVLKNDLPNYDLTFSGSANNAKSLAMTARAIKDGKRTVLAINTAESKGEYKMPDSLGLIPLVNMDDTDVRFKDAADAVGVLKRKGSNKQTRAHDEQRDGFFFNQSNINKLAALVAA